jgi:hypothetical protein
MKGVVVVVVGLDLQRRYECARWVFVLFVYVQQREKR